MIRVLVVVGMAYALWCGVRVMWRILWTNPEDSTIGRIRRIHDQAQRPRQERL